MKRAGVEMALSLVPGLRLRYELGQLIARGGMASVYEVYDERGRAYAAKIPHRKMLQNEASMQRFVREAALLCALRCPFIVRGLGLGDTERGRPMLVMERLHGEDLATSLQRMGRVPILRAVLSIVHGCVALSVLHGRGIIHRDLKPSNLFVTDAPDGLGPAVLLDLGVVKPLGSGEPGVTNAGCVVGSPAYMAPEQMLGQDDLDHRADIWSVGVVLYELLVGRVPFDGSSMMHVLSRALFGAKSRLSDLRSDVPSVVEAVVDRCLAVEPAQRFASALDVARALLPVLPPWLARRAADALSMGGDRPSGAYALAAGDLDF